MKKEKRKYITRRFSSYILIGLAAFCIEYLIFFMLISVPVMLLLAQSLSFLTGLLISFYGNKRLTFSQPNDYRLKGHVQLWRYLLLAFINLLLTNAVIYITVNYLSVNAALAKLFVMGLVALWNYLIFSKFIFRSN